METAAMDGPRGLVTFPGLTRAHRRRRRKQEREGDPEDERVGEKGQAGVPWEEPWEGAHVARRRTRQGSFGTACRRDYLITAGFWMVAAASAASANCGNDQAGNASQLRRWTDFVHMRRRRTRVIGRCSAPWGKYTLRIAAAGTEIGPRGKEGGQ